MSDTESSLLLTNDDGWDAPGLEALRQAAVDLGHCRVIAPGCPQSGCGHRVTTHMPIAVTRLAEDRFSTSGTPADCVRLALHHLAPKVSWVLAGINAGANLGADIHHSGTVAAAREGVLNGIPAIALSHYLIRHRPVDWVRAARWARHVLCRLMALPWQAGTLWNVNFPHLAPDEPDPGMVVCPLDPSPLPLAYRLEGDQALYAGDYQSRARRAGSDVDVCFQGRIAVTLIRVLDAGNAAGPWGEPVEPAAEGLTNARHGLADPRFGMP